MSRKMSVTEFGDLLIRTQDLDPAYVGLRGAALGRDQLCRWLLAYWCFYHVGAACYLSENEGSSFWKGMLIAAENTEAPRVTDRTIKAEVERWPRAAERRHFRGKKCVDAVECLFNRYLGHPEQPVQNLINLGNSATPTEKVIMNKVQTWPMFGPWIAFKAADMLERVAGVPIKFDANLGLMYEEPRAALDILVELGPDAGKPVGAGDWTREQWYNALSMYFRAKLAPPGRDRVCGPQELETVLCKWKSYMGGHYHVGKDIKDHRGALAGWGSTAASMLAAMPEEVQ